MPAPRKARKKYTYRGSYKKRSSKFKGLKKLFRLMGFSITGLVLFATAFYLYTLTENLRNPFAKASDGVDYTDKSYDSTDPFNIMIVDLENKNDPYSKISNLYIYHIDPVNNRGVVFDIPTDVDIDFLSVNDEKNNISGLYGVGNLYEDTRGIKILYNFVKGQFSILPNAYIIYDAKSKEDFKRFGIDIDINNLGDSIKYSYFLKVSNLFDFSRKDVLSDLSSIEMVKIIGDTKNITPSSYKYIKLEKHHILNPYDFDSVWQDNTYYLDIDNERHTVTILNSTSTPGLANWGARVVKNVKGGVLEVGNHQDILNENIIYSSLDDSKLLNYLIEFYNVQSVKPSSDYTENPFLAKRSDILLVLGKKAEMR